MNNDFLNEIQNCDISDLQLILKDQSDLYTPEELELIRETLDKKQNVLRGTFSGDWIFCRRCFLIYGISLLVYAVTKVYPAYYAALIYVIYIRLNRYQMGEKNVSAETLHSVVSFLYPFLGLVISIMYLIISIISALTPLGKIYALKPLGKCCFRAALISFMIQMLLISGGFRF